MVEIQSEAEIGIVCPYDGCEETVALKIPVVVKMADLGLGEYHLTAEVDDEVSWEQPAWDHVLAAHGPSLDD